MIQNINDRQSQETCSKSAFDVKNFRFPQQIPPTLSKNTGDHKAPATVQSGNLLPDGQVSRAGLGRQAHEQNKKISKAFTGVVPKLASSEGASTLKAGQGAPTSILSEMCLANWRGSATAFEGFTGTIPSNELNNVGWSEMRNFWQPNTPVELSEKGKGKYAVPCALQEAPLVGKTCANAQKKGDPVIGKMRSKDHVTEASLLIMDVDGLPEDEFIACVDRIKDDGITFLAFSTYSHGDPNKPGMRVRLVIPLDLPVKLEAYQTAWYGFDCLYFDGRVSAADPSGARMYQQQGTWCCHPSRVNEAMQWSSEGGVAATGFLLERGRSIQASQANHKERSVPEKRDRINDASCHPCDPIGIEKLAGLVRCIDPDCGYSSWLRVCMAIFHATKGSAEGLALFDRWSSEGEKYKGINEIRSMWNSLRLDIANPVTIATLVKMAKELVCESASLPCEGPVVTVAKQNPLQKYSLRGKMAELRKQMVDQVYILDGIALQGQSTVIYAAPNTGKTLLTLRFLVDGIGQGLIDPNNLFYVNEDDSANGLVEKAEIAEEYGFNMLSGGFADFNTHQFLSEIKKMTDNGHAHGLIIVCDTVKKFTDLMDKKKCSDFTKIIRDFTKAGGTFIGLAHTNKNRGLNGKPVHAGTSDLKDDFDCAYILDTVSEDAGKKVVEFTNEKKRGNVVESVSYSYVKETQYDMILTSVEKVDGAQLNSLKQAAKELPDAEVIEAIGSCIKEGITTKMRLVDSVAKRCKVSKKSAQQVIKEYTGPDPIMHKWNFEVKGHGANVYVLHDRPSAENMTPSTTSM